MSRKVFKLDCFITVHMSRNKYQRLEKGEIEIIKRLTLKGKSLREISKILNLNITTIYYQVRKFKPKQVKDLNPSGLNDEKIGELIGAFAGDGSFYKSVYKRARHYKIRYTLCTKTKEEQEYIDYLMRLLLKLNLNPHVSFRRNEGCADVGVNSKEYIQFIEKFLIWEDKKTYSVQLRNSINSYNQEFLRGFVRGLMDTDGWVGESSVFCGSVSKNLIENLAAIFDTLGISYKLSKRNPKGNQKEFNLIRVPKNNLQKYLEIIGFSNLAKLNKLKTILKK